APSTPLLVRADPTPPAQHLSGPMPPRYSNPGPKSFHTLQRNFCGPLKSFLIADSLINGNQHPSRSKITLLESQRLFPLSRCFFDLLLSESQKSRRSVDLIRFGIEPKRDIDFARRLTIPIFLDQNPPLYRMGFGQLRVERERSFRRCQTPIAT